MPTPSYRILKHFGEAYFPVGHAAATIYKNNGTSDRQTVAQALDSIATSLGDRYTKTEVNNLINTIHSFEVIAADTLPTASASTMNKIYLIPKSSGQTNNARDEYITLSPSANVFTWEKIGDTEIDLSGKADKVTNATNGHLAELNSSGNLVDSGVSKSDVSSTVSNSHTHSNITLSTTAQNYDSKNHTIKLPDTDPYTSARTPSSHPHGNISNSGTLTDTAAAAETDDKLVIRDASNNAIQTSNIKATEVAEAVANRTFVARYFGEDDNNNTSFNAIDSAFQAGLKVILCIQEDGAAKYVSDVRTNDDRTYYRFVYTEGLGTSAYNNRYTIDAEGGWTVETTSLQVALTFDNTPTANSNNPVKSGGVYTALSGKADSNHNHGNIQNGGTLQTTDVTIASGDKLVITDNSDSNKVARASAAFDGSTTTKALTQKGTFETFLQSHQDISGKADIVDISTHISSGSTIPNGAYYTYAGQPLEARLFVNLSTQGKAHLLLRYIVGSYSSSSGFKKYTNNITYVYEYIYNSSSDTYTFSNEYNGSNTPDYVKEIFGDDYETAEVDDIYSIFD